MAALNRDAPAPAWPQLIRDLAAEWGGWRVVLGLLVASWPVMAAGPQGGHTAATTTATTAVTTAVNPAVTPAATPARTAVPAAAAPHTALRQTLPGGRLAASAQHTTLRSEGDAATEPAPAPLADGLRVLLAPEQETTLAAQLGARIGEVGVALGEPVRRGQVLVRFDCEEQAARLRMSQAELATGREQLEAKLRLQGLQQAGEVEVALAAGQVAKAEAQVQLVQAQILPCTVTAPFSGRVVKLHVRTFQGVTPGQPLVELVSDGPLKVRLHAPSRWAGRLKRGTRFQVQIDETGRRYGAEVQSINGRVDPVSQTIELEGRVRGRAGDLLPGMSGSARFGFADT